MLQLNQLRESSDRDMVAAKKQVEDLEMRLEEARKQTAATERYRDKRTDGVALFSHTLNILACKLIKLLYLAFVF